MKSSKMNFKSYFATLINKGILFIPEGDRLFVKSVYKSHLSSTDKDFIKNNKAQIIAQIQKTSSTITAKESDMLFAEELYENTAYNNVICFLEVNGKLNIKYLEKSIHGLILRHDALRSNFSKDHSGFYINKIIPSEKLHFKLNVQIIDKNQLKSITLQNVNYKFDLSKELPIKVMLCQHSNLEYSLILILHHIITDSWSLSIMLRDLDTLYKKQIKNSIAPLDDLPFNYRNYLTWEILHKQLNQNKNFSYWQDKLNNSNQLLTLPIINNNEYPANSNASEWFLIHDDTYALLQKFCTEQNSSVFIIILATFYWVLRIYSGDNAINIGTAVANRKFQSVESMLGFFIDVIVLPIEADFDNVNSFVNLVKFVQSIFIDAMEHQVAIHDILPNLTFTRPLKRKPLFQVMYVHQNDENNYKNLLGLNITRKYIKPNYSLFDLSFETREVNSRLECCLQYRQDILNKDFICNLIETLQHGLKQLLLNYNAPLYSISMITSAQYDLIIKQFNKTEKPYPQNKTIHQLFEQQAVKTPNNIALICEERKLTYNELNQKSNQLANYIKKEYKNRINKELPLEALIALCLDRNLEIIIGILGILKAGGVYVPIDPAYPQSRVDYILNDTQAKLILTTALTLKKIKVKTYVMEDTRHPEKFTFLEKKSKINLPKDKIIKIDLTNKHIYQEKNDKTKINPSVQCKSNNLAYVIYTSGTTGNPKGVMVEHLQIASFIFAITDKILSLRDAPLNLLSTTNYVFDIFGLEYALPLLNGYFIDLANNDLLKNKSRPFRLNNYNIIQLTPSKLEWFFFNVSFTKSNKTHFITMLIGGEELTPWHIKLIHAYEKQNKNIKFQLINVYGPTETTIWSSICPLSNDAISIGRPLPNETAYILNAQQFPVPIGAIGELYIGGSGVARGYLNQAELSKDKFIPNPFQTKKEKLIGKNSRIYKTGDLVRMLPNGNITYIGRNDFQVKIRGFRIELGEIEKTIANIPGIKQSCVVLKSQKSEDEIQPEEGANKFLVGYYILNQESAPNITSPKKLNSRLKARKKTRLTEEKIYRYLTETLPEYMIPNHLVAMKEFPLTVTGKLDKKALPDPTMDTNKDNYTAPDNEIESTLCKIFASILGSQIERISTTADFFRLGGNSILATHISHKISQAFITELKVADIFKYKTVKNLAEYLINNSQKLELIHIPTSTVKHSLLSFAQQRLWFIEEYEEGSNAYNIPILYQIPPNINLDGLKYALQNIIKRHEVLRSTINELEQTHYNATQIVHEAELEIQEEILTQKITEVKFNTIIKKEIQQPFDLRHKYPIRIKIYKKKLSIKNDITHKEERFLLVNMHHIASDGWSIEIFEKELFEFYCAFIEKRSVNLPLLEIQYKDYAVWQRSYLANDSIVLKEQLAYWKKKLMGYRELDLTLDYSRPTHKDYSGANMFFYIPVTLSTKLRELTKLKGTTLHTILLSIFNILLSKYTNQEEIVIGSPIANRHHQQTENLIGFFVNTQVHRTVIKKNQTFANLLKETHKNQIEAQLHQDIPFEKLIDELKVEREVSRHPIFQVMFGVQSFGASSDNNNILVRTNLANNYRVAKFDLTLMLDDKLETIRGNFNYATSLFKNSTIKCFEKYYIHLIKQLLDEPNKIIKDISLLTQDEFHKIVYAWNKTTKKYPDSNIQQLFEEQVARTPDNVAIVYENIKLTYQELNIRSNQLAHYLRKAYKIKGNDLIALFLDRSEDMIIAILAVLKSGAAYVPMDPSYPDERISYILKNTQTKIILTNEAYQNKLKNIISTVIHVDVSMQKTGVYENKLQCEICLIDTIELQLKLRKESSTNLKLDIASQNLAYVIYTSGTTGKPKGVTIEHGGVINLAIAQNKAFGLNDPQIKIGLLYSSYVFDAHVSELFTIILFGKTLHIINDDIRHDIALLSKYIITNKIDVATIPPVLLTQDYLLKLKTLIVAGDKTDIVLMNQYFDNNVVVINAYGPTESTVCATLHKYQRGDLSNNIGKPIANSKVYILDSNLKPLPCGSIGELYIGGINLARGYLNNQELTTENFIPNPFQTELEKKQHKNARLYKSGDLARYLDDGNIEYIGRNDFQVKIRGYRIELGEIENKLASYPGIKQVVVQAYHEIKNSEQHAENRVAEHKYLVGYYVSKKKLDEEDIRKYLADSLPDYMIPHVLVYLKKLPLTINGKLDIKDLPRPQFKHIHDYIAPRNELEINLCKIYAEVLGLPVSKIGINDDFFKLGGDSIKSIRLQSLAKRHHLIIRVADVFTYKSIEAICKYVLHEDMQIDSQEKQMKGKIPLHPIQHWFFNLKLPNINWFNMAIAITLPQNKLNHLAKAVEMLQNIQSSFRIKFKKSTTGYIQFYTPINKFTATKLELKTVKHLKDIEVDICHLQQSLNIEKQLYRFIYFKSQSSKVGQFIFICHHLLIDGVSLRIIIDYFKETCFNQPNDTTPTNFADINSYKDFSISLNSRKNHITPDIINRWQHISNQVKKSPIKQITYNAAIRDRLLLSKSDTQKLKNAAVFLDSQLQHILIASFFYALTDSFKQQSLVIAFEGYGRKLQNKQIDISNTLGWFTTIYPALLSRRVNNIKGNEYRILKQVEVDMSIAEVDSGLSFGILNWLTKTNTPSLLNEQTINFSFNFLGEIVIDDKLNIKVISNSVVDGNNYLPQPFCMNALITNGILQMNFIVSPLLMPPNQISLLIEQIQNNLQIFAKCKTNNYSYKPIPDFHPVTLINEFANSSKVLTFIHTGSAGSEVYMNNLAKYLTHDIKIQLFDNLILRTKIKILSIQDLAKIYVTYLLKVQPFGPYYLGGLSFGALVAMEMANILREMNEVVVALFLVDPIIFSDKIRYKHFNNQNMPINVSYQPKQITTISTILFKCVKLYSDATLGAQLDSYSETVFNMPYNGLEKNYLNLHKIELNCDHESTLLDKNIHIIIDKIESIMLEKHK